MEASLPEVACEKLAAFRDAELDARQLVQSCIARINELNHAIALAPDGDRVRQYEAEIARLSTRQMEQQSRYQHFAALNTRLKDFVRVISAQPGEIEETRTVPKMQRGETVTQAVDRVRSEIDALRTEQRKVKAAPPPLADLKAAAKAHVAAIAAQGKPRVTATHSEFGFKWIGDWGPRLNLEAIFAWLYPEALVEKLYAELDGLPKVGLALSMATKRERLSALASQILAAEQQEEALIMAASDQGQQIMRRADVANLDVVIGLVVKKQAARFAA